MTNSSEEIPEEVIAEAERLTRLIKTTEDDEETDLYLDQRDDLLAEYEFVARIREEDDTLVCYPADWLDETGTVRIHEIENTNRAVEVPFAGPGEQGDYDFAATHNADLAERVRETHGQIHGANADAFAEFMSNHYARPMETASPDERAEFVTSYFPRNAWPSDEQREVVERSLDLIIETADAVDN